MPQPTWTRILSKISEYIQIALGVFLSSIGLKAFLLPNNFLDGGVTGIALLINTQIDINVSLLLVILSLPFIILAYRSIAPRIAFKSVISILVLAIAIEVGHFPVVTDDKLLIAIFGGLFVGSGIGIAIRNGAVLDGSEILGVFLHDRFGLGIGQVILVFNIILFCITALFISVEIAMYSILTYLVTAKVTDFIIEGFEDYIGVQIISPQHEDIRNAILEKLGVGMTIYMGQGGYGYSGISRETKIIHTVINRLDLRKIHSVVEAIDPNAFMVEYDVNNIKGGVMRHYLKVRQDNPAPTAALQNSTAP